MEEARPGSSDRQRSLALIEAAEARQRQAEVFTWTVPSLALTSQAFLLTIAFSRTTHPWPRLWVAVAGLATLAAAAHFLGKHSFNFDLFEAVIERERLKLGYDRIGRHYLLADIDSFPEDTLLRQRGWTRHTTEPGYPHGTLYRGWMHIRNPVIVQWKAIWIWGGALLVLALIDLGILINSLTDLA